jgi:hypothetical protein
MLHIEVLNTLEMLGIEDLNTSYDNRSLVLQGAGYARE